MRATNKWNRLSLITKVFHIIIEKVYNLFSTEHQIPSFYFTPIFSGNGSQMQNKLSSWKNPQVIFKMAGIFVWPNGTVRNLSTLFLAILLTFCTTDIVNQNVEESTLDSSYLEWNCKFKFYVFQLLNWICYFGHSILYSCHPSLMFNLKSKYLVL